MMFIIANIIALCCEVDDQDPAILSQIQDSYILFSIVFILEAALKLFVLGFVNYFDNHWNQYFIINQIRLFHRVCFDRRPVVQSDFHFGRRHNHAVPENPENPQSVPDPQTSQKCARHPTVDTDYHLLLPRAHECHQFVVSRLLYLQCPRQ